MLISRNKGCIFRFSLSNQQTVKRISVMERKSAHNIQMDGFDREYGEMQFFLRNLYDV